MSPLYCTMDDSKEFIRKTHIAQKIGQYVFFIILFCEKIFAHPNWNLQIMKVSFP